MSAEIVTVGLDGASRPMYRYRADLDLPSWEQRIVAPEDRPDYRTCSHCGQGIVPAVYGTGGYYHIASRNRRCDGMAEGSTGAHSLEATPQEA